MFTFLLGLPSFIRFIGSFIVAYGSIVGAVYAFTQPITQFLTAFLERELVTSWFFIFYVLPAIPACVVAIIAAAKRDSQPFLTEFREKTDRILERSRTTITGTGTSFDIPETTMCETELAGGNPVLLHGEAGTGKSGIGVILIESARAIGKGTLLVDARELGHIYSEVELSRFYRSDTNLAKEIAVVGNGQGFRLVIDQLDNLAGKNAAKIISDFAIDCSRLSGVQVVVISRRREAYENQLLQPLGDNGFARVECAPLGEQDALTELRSLGIAQPSRELIQLARNLLNLDIISKLVQRNPAFAFQNLSDEVALWDAYFDALRFREFDGQNLTDGDRMMSEAMRIAERSFQQDSQEFNLDLPLSDEHRRLVSANIIEHVDGMRHRFVHERIRDYLFARYAADRGQMPSDIVGALGPILSRNIMVWVEEIYRSRESPAYERFLGELLNG